MARTVGEDHIQSFRFQVFEVAGGAGLLGAENASAGFTTVTTPEITIETTDHRTGSEKLTRKHAGPPSFGDGTMSRGILRGDTTIYQWFMAYMSGLPFRADLEIKVYDQTAWGVEPGNETVVAYQKWFNCIPTSYKLLGDLDASASDINMQELTVAVENVEYANEPA